MRFCMHYTPPGRDLYCSPCRLYVPTYRSSPHIPLEEVMWQAQEEVYSDNLLRRLCRQCQCVCACRSRAGVGAGSRDRVHTPCAMDHEGLLKAYIVCYRK